MTSILISLSHVLESGYTDSHTGAQIWSEAPEASARATESEASPPSCQWPPQQAALCTLYSCKLLNADLLLPPTTNIFFRSAAAAATTPTLHRTSLLYYCTFYFYFFIIFFLEATAFYSFFKSELDALWHSGTTKHVLCTTTTTAAACINHASHAK